VSRPYTEGRFIVTCSPLILAFLVLSLSCSAHSLDAEEVRWRAKSYCTTPSLLLRSSILSRVKNLHLLNVELFPVHAGTMTRIKRQLDRKGPVDLERKRRFALFSWVTTISLSTSTNRRREFIGNLRFPCNRSVRYPRGTRAWRLLERGLQRHEEEHLLIHAKMVETIRRECTQGSIFISCMENIVGDFKRFQISFDDRDNHLTHLPL
jgi:Bacterial protein of unknown function (DUF922)